jgi:hypothetical protein
LKTKKRVRSVAEPGCLSRILNFIHPGSRIPNLATAPKEEGKKCLSYHFLLPQISYIKIVNNFIFKTGKENFLAKTQGNIKLFTQQFVIKLSKKWV